MEYVLVIFLYKLSENYKLFIVACNVNSKNSQTGCIHFHYTNIANSWCWNFSIVWSICAM